VVVAGTHSGVGKTTVATGLMAVLRRHGLRVASAKVGPDFIDPGYHALATGRPGCNLDPYLCDPADLAALAMQASAGADLLVVEGVMGLFDGVGASTVASTAHVAELLAAPVLLVVDASSMSGSVTALVAGYDDQLRRQRGTGIAGVVLNRVGSETHERILREALGDRVVGVLRRDPTMAWRDRHLGLVPVVEQPAAVRVALDRLAEALAGSMDLARIEGICRSAPGLVSRALVPTRRIAGPAVPVAVVGGPAFTFAYPENLRRLRDAGADLVPVDPLVDTALPPGVRALYACGGFPEVFVEALSSNVPLREDVHRQVAAGMVTWAECGGLLWLSRSLEGRPLCGAIGADARMGGRIVVGYREAEVRVANPVAPAGASLRGHELHYSTLEPAGDALALSGTAGSSIGGWAGPTLLASYLHVHLGSDPGPAERFVATAAGTAGVGSGRSPQPEA
jgi:cobyrinic acid a,c-diamide synthase